MPGLGCKLFWINKYLNSGDIFDCWNHGTNNVSMFHVEIGKIVGFNILDPISGALSSRHSSSANLILSKQISSNSVC